MYFAFYFVMSFMCVCTTWHWQTSGRLVQELNVCIRVLCTVVVYLSCKRCPGGAFRYRRGPHLRYVFRGGRGLFLRPPHVRDFVKEGYFFVPRYEVWGSKSPYNPRNIRGSGLTSLLPPLAAAKQAEDYKILS